MGSQPARDPDGEIERGQLGIVSTLAMPAPIEYAGTPTTRIVRSVVGASGRTATVTHVPLACLRAGRSASAGPSGRSCCARPKAGRAAIAPG